MTDTWGSCSCAVCSKDLSYTQAHYIKDDNICHLQDTYNFIKGVQVNKIHKTYCFDCYLSEKKRGVF